MRSIRSRDQNPPWPGIGRRQVSGALICPAGHENNAMLADFAGSIPCDFCRPVLEPFVYAHVLTDVHAHIWTDPDSPKPAGTVSVLAGKYRVHQSPDRCQDIP